MPHLDRTTGEQYLEQHTDEQGVLYQSYAI